MGYHGPAPKPTAIRIREGMRAHKPLPPNEPKYGPGLPLPPATMSPSARKYWDRLLEDMASTGVLRVVDWMGLAKLCEDHALHDMLLAGFWSNTQKIREKQKQDLKLFQEAEQLSKIPVPGKKVKKKMGRPKKAQIKPVVQSIQEIATELASSIDGRRLLSSIGEIANRIQIQYREYGLTPAANSRVEASGGASGYVDPLEAAIAG